jgi:hypothetical protein
MPTHWDLHGNVNGWSSRTFGAFALPTLVVALLVFMVAGDWLSPARSLASVQGVLMPIQKLRRVLPTGAVGAVFCSLYLSKKLENERGDRVVSHEVSVVS